MEVLIVMLIFTLVSLASFTLISTLQSNLVKTSVIADLNGQSNALTHVIRAKLNQFDHIDITAIDGSPDRCISASKKQLKQRSGIKIGALHSGLSTPHFKPFRARIFCPRRK